MRVAVAGGAMLVARLVVASGALLPDGEHVIGEHTFGQYRAEVP